MKNSINIECRHGVTSRIVIGSLDDDLHNLLPADHPRIIIITDGRVHSNNLEFINSYDRIVIGQGESSKTLFKLEDVYRQLFNMGADRNSFIIGMGGGIITDITGFIASTYMRGLRFGFIPTTLLAQVDAGIGGKNGINLDGYKNIIGVFRQPEFVLCDPGLLSSLPDKEFRAGLAEVIKAGIIADPELFELVEAHSFEEIRSNKDLLHDMILRAVKVKTAIVERDEEERGERRKLNLGHTFAHALEKSFTNLSHGEAVAAGIATICDASVRMGKLSASDNHRIKNLLIKMGLPVEYPVETKKLLSAVRLDKKREGNDLYLVFPHRIGECNVEKVVTEQLEDIFIDREAELRKAAEKQNEHVELEVGV